MNRSELARVLLFLAVGWALFSITPAWAQRSSDSSLSPQPKAFAAATGKSVKSVGVDAQDLAHSFGQYPDTVNSVVMKVSTGPTIATWTGEIINVDSTADLVIGIFAQECLDGQACTTLGPDILSYPSVSGPVRNYTLVETNPGFARGTLTVTTLWPAGSLVRNRYHLFTARVGGFSGDPPGNTRLRTLKIEAYK